MQNDMKLSKIAPVAAVLCAATTLSTSFAETPDYFVEWVQPSAALYVDTGVKGKVGVKAEVKFANVSCGDYPVMLGSWGARRFNLIMHWGQQARWEYGDAMRNWGAFPWYGTLVTAEVEVSAAGAMTGTWTDQAGGKITPSSDDTATYGSIDTDLNLFLFASNKSGSPSQPHLGRLYRAKLWTGDTGNWTPARDFIPCVKDGVAGLYDTVSQTIFHPQGNTLVAGPAKNDSGYAIGSVTHPATQWGRIAYGRRGDMSNGQWWHLHLGDYTFMGYGDIDNLLNSQWRDSYLKWSQDRFDGWFQVSADKAGTWSIRQKFDDYFAIFIDNSLVLYNNSYTGEATSTVEVSAGWHRFTIIAGDTYGGYGPSLSFNGGNVPFTVTVNGTAYAFNDTNFPQGSGSNSYTLAANEDWTERGPILLAGGAVLDLNGHQLAVKDIACDEFVGAAITNSASKKAVLIFTGEPTESKAIVDGLVKEVRTKIMLAKAGELSATWTGAAGDGNALNADNWQDTLTGEAVVPTANHALLVIGDAVNLQIPSGSAFACKSIDIGNCTFAADCDWRGLSVTPSISGTADLAGHDLRLNALAADSGSSFANSSAAVSQVRFPVNVVNGAVTDNGLIANMGNLSVASNVRIVMVNDGSVGASADSPIGYLSGSTSGFVQTGGNSSFSSGKALALGKTSGGTALFRIESGTVSFGGVSAQNVAGAHALVELAGGELRTGWLDLGNNSSGSATINQTRGAFIGTGNIWIGRNKGGTGVYNLTGGTFGTGLVLGQVSGTTGRMTVGGAGVANLTRGGTVGAEGVGYLTITNGGTVTAASFLVGGNNSRNYANAAGTVTLTGGELNVNGNSALVVGQYKTGTLDIGGDGVVTASAGVKLGNQTSGSGTLLIRENGVLNVPKIVKGGGTASVVIDGGTLVAKNASDGAFIDVDTLDVGTGTIDTDGHDVTVAADVVNLYGTDGTFTKKGAGTLTFPAMPSTGALTVEKGTLALSLSSAVVNRARLAHRWSFNGSTEEENLADSAGGAVAAKIGDGVSFADGAATFSGDGNSKGSLRLGDAGAALLGTGDGATVEIWATRNDVKNWARAFDYGNNQNWWWHLTWNNGTDGTKFEVGGCRNNNTKTTSYNAPWADGTKVYIVATFKANHDGTGNPYMKWAVYDATTKARLASSGFTAANGLTLSDLSSATFYLGHSQYSSDYDAAATYDEVRLWRNALPDDAIAKSVEFGPDATAEQIAAIETMAVPRTVTVAEGATLDLGGGTLSQPCVNGFGTVRNGTLNVTGAISPGGEGVAGTIAMPGGAVTGEIRIDDGDLVRVTGGTLDLSAATLTLAGLPAAPFDVVTVADGAAATISGIPALSVSDGSDMHGWQLRILDGGKRLRVCRKGASAIVY